MCMILQQGDALSSLVAVDLITGKQNLIFESKDGILDKIAWLPDGNGLLALYFGRDTNFTRRLLSDGAFVAKNRAKRCSTRW